MKIQPEEQYKFLKISLPDGTSANEHSVLLHACCAPCSAAIVECMLRNGIRPTVYFPIQISIRNRSLIFASRNSFAFCNSKTCPTWKMSTTMLTGKRQSPDWRMSRKEARAVRCVSCIGCIMLPAMRRLMVSSGLPPRWLPRAGRTYDR